jgi:hypothetical protein
MPPALSCSPSFGPMPQTSRTAARLDYLSALGGASERVSDVNRRLQGKKLVPCGHFRPSCEKNSRCTKDLATFKGSTDRAQKCGN